MNARRCEKGLRNFGKYIVVEGGENEKVSFINNDYNN